MTNCLCMPSTFVEVKDEEVEYLEGKFWLITLIGLACTAASIGCKVASYCVQDSSTKSNLKTASTCCSIASKVCTVVNFGLNCIVENAIDAVFGGAYYGW